MEENKLFYFVVGLLVVILVIGGIAYFFYGEQIKQQFTKDDEIEQIPLQEYKIYIKNALNNNLIEADYLVYQEELQRLKGRTTADKLEVFSNAYNNSNYSVAAWGDYFYYNKSNCDKEKYICETSLMPIGDYFFDYIPLGNEYRILIKPQNGTLHNPVLCTRWTYQLKKVSLKNMTTREVPSAYLNDYDLCYSLYDGYLSELKEFDVLVEKDERTSQTGNASFTLTLMDTCLANEANIFEGCAKTKHLNINTFLS